MRTPGAQPARWPTPPGTAPGGPASRAVSLHSMTCGPPTLERSSARFSNARLAAAPTPLPDPGAAARVRPGRAAPLLLGHRGTPAADLAALQDILMRVSRLADDLPQVAELDLNPVIARPDGAHVVDTRVRLLPARPADPYLRRLR